MVQGMFIGQTRTERTGSGALFVKYLLALRHVVLEGLIRRLCHDQQVDGLGAQWKLTDNLMRQFGGRGIQRGGCDGHQFLSISSLWRSA